MKPNGARANHSIQSFGYTFPPIDLRLDVGCDPAPFAMVHNRRCAPMSRSTLIVDFTQVEELEAFLEGRLPPSFECALEKNSRQTDIRRPTPFFAVKRALRDAMAPSKS